MSADDLRTRLDEHRLALRSATSSNEFLDLAAVEDLHARVRGELDRWDELSPDHHRTLTEAVVYLTTVDDQEDDAASPIGLEDDREVVEAALKSIRAGRTGSASPTT